MSSKPSRREILRSGAALAALSALAGCDRLLSLSLPGGGGLPDRFGLPDGETIDPLFHLLSRATYGPRPGDVGRFRAMGRDAWLDRQLRPAGIDETALVLRLSTCELVFDHPHDLESVPPRHVDRQLTRATLIRAVHAERQLLEVMTGFWTDHLSIDVGKRGCLTRKTRDDREVVRRHALGRFRDLIGASALSPAMLVYLDGRENRRATPDEQPNENYARELLELHTLGVHGGYTQKDVMEAARCLTGWTLSNDLLTRGEVTFRQTWHDDGEKVVLGRTIPAGGGQRDLDLLLDTVCEHESTARRLATKIVRHLVADPPPQALVTSTAGVFRRTGGQITDVVRHVLTSAEFEGARGARVKRPLRYVAGALRSLGVGTDASPREMDLLERMGHLPHHYPTPDGYPAEPDPWMGTLLWRWNFALALATGGLGRARPDLRALCRGAGLDAATASPADLAPLLHGRAATAGERATVDTYVAAAGGGRDARTEGLALLLAGPAGQVF